MTSDRREVLVVGGGPAGLTVASVLARAGRRVAVLDRGQPATVGPLLLSGPALEVLDELGWLTALRDLPGTVTSSRLRFESERESVCLEPCPELVVLGRGPALAEMRRRAGGLGVEITSGVTAVSPLWEGRRVIGVRGRDGGGGERNLEAAVVVDASGPSCWLGTAVGQLLPRRGPRRFRAVASVLDGVPSEPLLTARPGLGLLLLPGGHLVATSTCSQGAPPKVEELLETSRACLPRGREVRIADGAPIAARVGTLLLVQAGEGWLAVGEAAGCGAPWLPGRTSTGIAVAATAGWEVGLALQHGRAIGPGQLGATLTLSRQAVRLELLLDRALVRASAVGLVGAATATPRRRQTLAALLLGSWAPLRGTFRHLCYLWWLDLKTRRARRRVVTEVG